LKRAVTIETASNATTVEIKVVGTFKIDNIATQVSPDKRPKMKISPGCCFKNVVSLTTDLTRLPLLRILKKT
jgi:hypothetical protein